METKTYSDEEILFAHQSINFFIQFYPHYLANHRAEYDQMMAKYEEGTTQFDNEVHHQIFLLMKLTFRFEETIIASIKSFTSTQHQFYHRYFSENLIITEQTQTELTPSQRKFLQTFLNKITSMPYPVIWYYTTVEGQNMWFVSKKPIAYYPGQFQRKLQFYAGEWKEISQLIPPLKLYCEQDDDLTQLEREKITDKPDLQLFCEKEDLEGEGVTDECLARRKVVEVYKMCSRIISDLLEIEFMKLQLLRQDLSHVGVVYRGDVMPASQFQEFQEKIHTEPDNSPYHKFSWNLSSTSTRQSVAEGFSTNTGGTSKRILHKIHLVKPEEEDLNEFIRLFPDIPLCHCALSIETLSDFKQEKEVLCPPNMDIQIVNITESSNLFTVESYAPILQPRHSEVLEILQDSLSVTDALSEDFINDEEWKQFQMAIFHKNTSLANNLKSAHPEFVPKLYFEYLNRLTIARCRNRSDSIVTDTYRQLNYLKQFA